MKVEIKRSEGKTDNYDMEYKNGMTVLDVVEDIYKYHDPTIAYRYSCRTGLCATCNMMINKKPGLSCMTLAEPGENGKLTIGPMPRGETIRDLVKEM
ncbi:2Fe-2S iron-sulfur cluster-binding protein [Alteribacillus bidgolensis]|uniref:Succinate dehydrogenase / fumarate reductase iron-sulfur subunit/fumarate reductase iron-sulfur subunit n=1 Tax=Alteribacillus bidgolensis TaxID=930129 RepID=A0A1G8JEQ6_9BACI|nr:2Fe-2S iron-sulfur cluster-binding protein [Alteribacillus bidgolensis]SDI29477.1 succinate dehydrogenase / fumarate reductase iron-sulfur subunit/fumarate reductase iron-sulfur subunit [Alteribacillus bidgolensis]